MGRDNDGFAVFDVRLETVEPISAGTFEAIEIQDSYAREHTGSDLVGLERSVELPSFVRRIEIVRRDENLEAMLLCCLEDALHVLDGMVFLKTFVDEGPREASFTQDLILRIDKDYRGVALVDVHRIPLFDSR